MKILTRLRIFFQGLFLYSRRVEQLRDEVIDANAMLEMVLDNLPNNVYIKSVDHDFRYIMCSNSTLRWSRAEVLGCNDFDLYPREFAEASRKTDQELAERGGSITGIEKHQLLDGNKIFVKVYRRLITRRDGTKLIMVVMTDITQDTEQKATIAKSNGILCGILNNLPAMIAGKDVHDDFRYVLWNKGAETLSGISADALLGKSDQEIPLWEKHAKAIRAQDNEVCETGELHRASTFRDNSGQMHELKTVMKTVQFGQEEFELVMGLDVTEERKLEREKNCLLEYLKVAVKQEKLTNLLLSEVSQSDDPDATLGKIQKLLGEYLNADHCFIAEYNDTYTEAECRGGWDAPDCMVKNKNRPPLHFDKTENWFRELQLGNMISRTGQEPHPGSWNSLGSLAESLEKNHIRGFTLLGIFAGGTLRGHLSIAFELRRKDRQLNNQQMQLLRSAARVVEILWERSFRRKQLEQSEFEKRLILESTNVPLMLFDPNHKLVRVNRAALEISGRPEAEIYLSPCYKNFCGFAQPPEGCPVKAAIADCKSHDFDITLNGHDYHMRATPIIIGGQLRYVLKTLIDMTEFNAALREAQSANQAKSYFLATISHEIRTPLNAVIGFSELLQNHQLPSEQQKEYLRSIQDSGNALLRLINDVLDLSKLESGKMKISPAPSNVTDMVKEVAAIFQYRLEEKKLTFKLSLPAEPIPVLEIDSLRFRQILFNLLGNAVKFTARGSVGLEMRFLPTNDQVGNLHFCVSDTGIGIDLAMQKKIFEPFTQENINKDHSIVQGSGLGLSIAKRLVERMGGSLTVESVKGSGSVFRADIPGLRYIPKEQTEKLTCVSRSNIPACPCRIMVVDDIPLNLKVMEAMLRKNGATYVSLASSGENVLHSLKKEHPDILFTDMWMPEMNGFELATKIRELPDFRDLPIVAVTADTEANSHFPMNVFAQVLLKPVTGEKLIRILHRFVPQAFPTQPENDGKTD